jgi:hypothetical protein
MAYAPDVVVVFWRGAHRQPILFYLSPEQVCGAVHGGVPQGAQDGQHGSEDSGHLQADLRMPLTNMKKIRKEKRK